nr:hypothetical protein [Tanacetum cinerariifolium]
MKDQPLPTDASPTALLPGYIDESNPEEDEEDPEEDPDGEDDEEEEHLALIDPSVVPIDDRIVLNTIPHQPCNPPNRDDWDRLFQPMFDEYFNPLTIVVSLVLVAAEPRAADIAKSPVSTSINLDVPSISIPSTPAQEHSLIISQGFEESPKTPHFHDDPVHKFLHKDSTSQGSSSNVRPSHTPFEHLGRWTKDHLISNVIGDRSRSVSTRKQLETNAKWCYFDAFLTSVEPKNFKQAMTKPSWFDAMQVEIHEFESLQVWELVQCPDKVMLIKLKWIYKVKTDEFGGELKEEVYVSQPEGFVDQDNPSHVYKLQKSLYGLKQAPHAWYDMLLSFLISQHFSKGVVDPILFTRKAKNDLLLAKPTEKHLNAVKRHSQYLKGTINMGLWYLKDIGMSLTAYSDVDHTGCQDTRRSTSGSAQFLGDKLVSNMNPVATQQVDLDNALVVLEKRLKIEKCNARIKFSKPQSKETYQVILDALKLSSCYLVFLITAEIKCISLGKHLLLSSIGVSLGRQQDLIGSENQELVSCKDKTISKRNKITLHTVRDDTLLGTLKFVSKTQDYQQYEALIPDEMINEDIKDSKAYKTYLDFAIGKLLPRKQGSLRKLLHPQRNCVVIRDNPSESVPKKKTPAKVDRGKDKTTATDKGTGIKLGVPDVPKYLSGSENKSWGDSGDDDSNDNDSDEVTKDDDDDVDSDANGEKEASDNEKTNSDEYVNLNFNQNDDEEEEYVRTPDSFEFTKDDYNTLCFQKIAPTRRTTRASSAMTTTTIPVINVQLKALIDQGIINALAARDANRIQNGDDSHNSRTGSRRTERTTLENQVKFSTCTIHGVALTWWKSHVKTVGQDAAHGMSWNTLMKMMTAKRMFPEESDKIEKYVGGLPDMIHVSVMTSKPKIMHDEVEFATELMDKKICAFAKRQTKNKRKQDDNQQQQNKRQNTGRAYTASPGEKNPYGGSKPLCSKCNYHDDGLCAPKCHKCNRVGHLAHDCRSHAATNNQRNLTCYECRNQGHYKSDCLKLKNQNHGN